MIDDEHVNLKKLDMESLAVTGGIGQHEDSFGDVERKKGLGSMCHIEGKMTCSSSSGDFFIATSGILSSLVFIPPSQLLKQNSIHHV